MTPAFARQMRAEATQSERILWSLLRRRTFGGFRFRRQQPIGPYIADFYCSAAGLIVELEGGHHTEQQNIERDTKRTAYLKDLGYRVIRIPNHEFMKEREVALEKIWRALRVPGPPSP